MSYIQSKPAFVVFMSVAGMDVTKLTILRQSCLSDETSSSLHSQNTTHHHDTEHRPK
jgi:hypothetical protein